MYLSRHGHLLRNSANQLFSLTPTVVSVDFLQASVIYIETIQSPESPIDGNAGRVVPSLKNIKFTFLISGSRLLLDRLIFS